MANYYKPREAREHAAMLRELQTSNTLGGRAVASWSETIAVAGSKSERRELRLIVTYAPSERPGHTLGWMSPPMGETYAFDLGAVQALESNKE